MIWAILPTLFVASAAGLAFAAGRRAVADCLRQRRELEARRAEAASAELAEFAGLRARRARLLGPGSLLIWASEYRRAELADAE